MCVRVSPQFGPKKMVCQSDSPQPQEVTLAQAPTVHWAHLARSKRSRRPSVQQNKKEMPAFTPWVSVAENRGGERREGSLTRNSPITESVRKDRESTTCGMKIRKKMVNLAQTLPGWRTLPTTTCPPGKQGDISLSATGRGTGRQPRALPQPSCRAGLVFAEAHRDEDGCVKQLGRGLKDIEEEGL